MKTIEDNYDMKFKISGNSVTDKRLPDERQNSKVIWHDLVIKVFVRYPGSSLVCKIVTGR